MKRLKRIVDAYQRASEAMFYRLTVITGLRAIERKVNEHRARQLAELIPPLRAAGMHERADQIARLVAARRAR